MLFIKNKKPLSLEFIGFLQAICLIFYCFLVSILFWRGNDLFGNTPNYWGPVLFLVIFSLSALICALIALGYPLIIFLERRKLKESLRIIFYMVGWLLLFVLLFLLVLVL
ncbi:MAG: hypothetical protein ABIB98_04005 [bacterium]